MKTYSLAALVSAVALTSVATAQQSFQSPALLIEESGAFKRVWLMAATNTSIRFRATETSTSHEDAKISDYEAIYLYEPAELSAAMDLYNGRKYEEAKAKFIEIQERFKPLMPLENSPGALAAFYEMECLRKLGDLEGLSAALQKLVKDPLTREDHLRQLELYVLWDAVRTKSWDRLLILTSERQKTRLPGNQRAQVAYCQGLALEGLERPKDEALLAYQTAITADAGASEEITRQAALRILAIHAADPEVKLAIDLWGSPDENKAGPGYSNLLEASAMASLYELSLGGGTALPAEYKKFTKFKAPVEG